jgi:hypothetical protein
VLELVAIRASVVSCFALPAALDELRPPNGASSFRAAPDEVMVMSDPGAGAPLMAHVETLVRDADTDALVLDATDGWSIWALVGVSAGAALSRLSEIEPGGDGTAQGDVAHLPARLVANRDQTRVLVPSMWGDYLRRCIVDRCASLGVAQRAKPEPWTWTNGRTAS